MHRSWSLRNKKTAVTRSKTTMTAERFRLMAPIYLRQWLVLVTGIPCVPLTTKARLRTTWSPLAPVTKKFQRGTYVVLGSLSNRPVCTCAGSRVCSLMLRLMAPYFYYALQSTQRIFSTDERSDVLLCSKLCLELLFWWHSRTCVYYTGKISRFRFPFNWTRIQWTSLLSELEIRWETFFLENL